MAIFPARTALLPTTMSPYVDTVPDTLDLAEVAKLYLQGMTQCLLPLHDYAPAAPGIMHVDSYGFTVTQWYVDDAGMYFARQRTACGDAGPCLETQEGVPNWGKVALGLYLARRMTNYDATNADGTLEAQYRSTVNMLSPGPNQTAYLRGAGGALQPFLNPGQENAITPTTVVLEFLMEVYRRQPTPALRDAIDTLVKRHDEFLLPFDTGVPAAMYWDNDGGAYRGEPSFTSEQGTSTYARAFIQGRALLVLAGWANEQHSCEAQNATTLLRNYVLNERQSELWAPYDLALYPQEPGQYVGHMHSHLGAAHAVLVSAIPLRTSNPLAYRGYVDFVKNVYAFTKRRTRADTLGHFGEVGTLGDMIRLGLRLSDLGELDAYDEISVWTRNQLVESQVDAVAAQRIPSVASADYRFDQVGTKFVGTFFSDATHAFAIPHNKNARWNVDGPSNAMRAVYEVWQHILSLEGSTLRVNLLLNRASRYLDVKSHAPYRGQVDFVTKASLGPITRLEVRLPDYAVGMPVSVTRAAMPVPYTVTGNLVRIANLAPSTTYTLNYVEPTATRQVTTLRRAEDFWYEGSYPAPVGSPGAEFVQSFNAVFRGATLVDVHAPDGGDPRRAPNSFARYQRDALRTFDSVNPTPTKQVTRAPLLDGPP